MRKTGKLLLTVILSSFFSYNLSAQVNAVKFGKNRVQYKKFKWQYYQSDNFNVYFNEGGKELAKYIAQVAEKELPQMESAAEYSLQRRANIVLYNDYKDMRQTNIGLETTNFNTGGYTKLVNNKMVVYFNANHADLRRQLRQGIANVLTQNILFGEDIGEVASNQTIMDLPTWMVDGYVSYLGENWSTKIDDDLRSEILSGNYNRFSNFAFYRPEIAGHAFWYFIEEKYKKENVTYLFYLMRTYKNIDRATRQVTKLKFKDLLAQFMEYQDEKYSQDVRRRRNYPKGSTVESFDINKRLNYYRFNVNPNRKNNSYVVTRFKNGIVSVIYNDGYENKTLLKYGARIQEVEMDPNYPMMAWDGKGTRLAVIYPQEGRLRMFVQDFVNNYKSDKLDLTDHFDQVQDVQYANNKDILLLSAVKNGHTDIYQFNIGTQKVMQITNDVYDDLSPSLVAFPNKTGIIFTSNRPSPEAKGGDSVLPSDNRFNVFMITDFGDKPELNQITKLTDLKYGNAKFPTQYNMNHFTFVSDENGIDNRYAGFFHAERTGFDTLVVIGDDILRNPTAGLIDSTLREYGKTETDTIAIVSVSKDSSYVFPLTNYPSNLAESRIAGDNDQVSEVTRQSDLKTLFKLKINEKVLQNRNISTPPTAYARKLMRESQLTEVQKAAELQPQEQLYDSLQKQMEDTAATQQPDDNAVFQSEFDTMHDSLKQNLPDIVDVAEIRSALEESTLKRLKLFNYKPVKYAVDFGSAGVNGTPLLNRYQPYMGGSGPIRLNSGTPLSGLIQLGTSEFMEDHKFTGAFRISTNLKDNEWFASYQNYKRRIDWGLSYYRNTLSIGVNVNVYDPSSGQSYLIGPYPGRMFTDIYQGNISYPFNEVMRLQLTSGIRIDRVSVSAVDTISVLLDAQKAVYSTNRLEFVYDNTLNPATNIWDGLRGKVYMEYNQQINKVQTANKPIMYNTGLDVRYYYPILRNFIWAGRAAADFSWGNQKICYFLGGVDSWLMFGNNVKVDQNGNAKDRYFVTSNPPAPDQNYAWQSLAVNMRGYIQNIASGNNAIVLNSEFRMPIFSTLFDRMYSNAFLNNLQLVQFIDLGTAWNGRYDGMKRPEYSFNNSPDPGNPAPVTVKIKTGGVGPFAGGYGFGLRSNVFGYFAKVDAGWPMRGFFRNKPVIYVALGLDF